MWHSPRMRRLHLAGLLMGASCAGLIWETTLGAPWLKALSLVVLLWQMVVFLREVAAAEPHRQAMLELMPRIDLLRSHFDQAADPGIAQMYQQHHDRVVDRYKQHRRAYMGHDDGSR